MAARKKVPSTVTVRCPPVLRRRVQAVADKLHISESALVLQLIEGGIGKADVIARMDRLEEKLDAVCHSLGWSDPRPSTQPAPDEEATAEPDAG